jgi:hypothetical protein
MNTQSVVWCAPWKMSKYVMQLAMYVANARSTLNAVHMSTERIDDVHEPNTPFYGVLILQILTVRLLVWQKLSLDFRMIPFFLFRGR